MAQAPAPAVVRIQIRTPRVNPVIGPAPIIRPSHLPILLPGPTPIVVSVQLPGQYRPIPSQPRVVVPISLPSFPTAEKMVADDENAKAAEELAKKVFDNQGKDLPTPVNGGTKPARRVVIEESELLDQIGSL